MELRAYWGIIRRRLRLVIAFTILGLVGAVAYNLSQPLQYEATTTLFLNRALAKTAAPSSDSVQSLTNTYAEFMRTRTFLDLMIEETKLSLTDIELRQSLTTAYVPDTLFFRITATSPDPRIAQLLANTAAKVLIDQNTARQQAEQEQIEEQQQANRQNPVYQAQLEASLRDNLATYTRVISDVQAEISQIEAAPTEENQGRLDQLRDQLLRLQTSRIDLLNTLSQPLSTDTAPPNIDTAVVVDAAPLPIKPVSRRTLQLVLIVFAIEIVYSLGLIFLLEYLDFTVKTPDALEKIYGAPVQGVIGNGRRKHGKDEPLIPAVIGDTSSPLAESIRALQISIQSAGIDAPLRSLLVTSAQPDEGKTFVAANLAASLAQNEKRVILVDTDLRKPRLHTIFGLDRDHGLTTVLLNQRDELASYLQQTGIDNLRVLTSGPIPPRPAELLGSQRAALVMQQLAELADIVVYDSPPTTTVTDAVIVAARVDATLQIVRAGQTRIDVILRCRNALQRVNARILGPVLNGVRLADLGYQPSYYYQEQANQAPATLWQRIFGQSKPSGEQARGQSKQAGHAQHSAETRPVEQSAAGALHE